MDTQKITKQIRLSRWGETVKERIAKGQSIKEFCRETGIRTSTYYYRQRKVREMACGEVAKAQNQEARLVPRGWTELVEAEDNKGSGNSLTIEINGYRVKVNTETDQELIAKVLRTLRSI